MGGGRKNSLGIYVIIHNIYGLIGIPKAEVKNQTPNFGEGFVSLVFVPKNHVWMI